MIKRGIFGQKGQVTLFVIIAIVIMAAVLLFMIIKPSFIKQQVSAEEAEKVLATQGQAVKDLIEKCVSESFVKGVILVGYQGGYYKPSEYETLGIYNVSYGCIKENGIYQNTLPFLTEIGRELEKYIASSSAAAEIDNCLKNFDSFKKAGIEVKPENRVITVGTIELTYIPVSIKWPLTLKAGSASMIISEMDFKVKSGLGIAHQVAAAITKGECTEGKFDIPIYLREHPIATVQVQVSNGKTYYYLITIPQEGEDPFNFHFIVNN